MFPLLPTASRKLDNLAIQVPYTPYLFVSDNNFHFSLFTAALSLKILFFYVWANGWKGFSLFPWKCSCVFMTFCGVQNACQKLTNVYASGNENREARMHALLCGWDFVPLHLLCPRLFSLNIEAIKIKCNASSAAERKIVTIERTAATTTKDMAMAKRRIFITESVPYIAIMQ